MANISNYNPGIRSLDHKGDGTLLVGTRGSEIYELKSEENFELLL